MIEKPDMTPDGDYGKGGAILFHLHSRYLGQMDMYLMKSGTFFFTQKQQIKQSMFSPGGCLPQSVTAQTATY